MAKTADHATDGVDVIKNQKDFSEYYETLKAELSQVILDVLRIRDEMQNDGFSRTETDTNLFLLGVIYGRIESENLDVLLPPDKKRRAKKKK